MAEETARAGGAARTWLDSDLGLLLLLGVLWGAAFPVIRWGLLAGASPFAFVAYRWALAAGVMGAIAWATRVPRPHGRDSVLLVVLGGVFLIGGYGAFLYWGEQGTPGGLSAVLTGTVPLASALLAYFVLPSERLTWRGSLGIAVGFGGLLLLFLPDLVGGGAGAFDRELAVVGAATMTAIGSVLIRRWVRAPADLWTLTAQFAFGAGFLAAVTWAFGQPLVLPAVASVWWALAYLVVASSVAGYWVYFRLLHRVGPARTNVVTYITPFAGIAVGVALLGESVGPYELAGFAVILAGLYLLQRDRLRRKG